MKRSLFTSILLTGALLGSAIQTTQGGWIRRYIYHDIPGSAVANLLWGTNIWGQLVFPDNPSETELIPPSPYGPYWAEAVDNASWPDNYGSWIPGYIEPPETGYYTFWVYGDAETQLWLTTNAATPLNPALKQMLCAVPEWTSFRQWNKYAQQQSAPVYLEKGKQYYFEILHKEGTGGDRAGWGWQLPNGVIERPMRSFYLQPTFSTNDPTSVYGPYVAALHPPSTNDDRILDGREAMVWVDLNLTPPYSVQWRRNTTEIPGATQTYYRFRAALADSGAQYYVRVNGIWYGPVTLNVYADDVRPELVSAEIALANPTQINVVFSKDVTPASAQNPANYTLSAGTVQSASLQADFRTVILKTTLLAPGTLHTLTVSGVQDWANPPNTMLTTSTNLIVADGAISYRLFYSNNVLPSQNLAGLRTWSNTNSTSPSYTNNQYHEERIVTSTTQGWPLTPLRDNYIGQLIGYVTAPVTGNYKFAIASDEHSILYLGTTDARSSKREICRVDGSTGQWNIGANVANQQSAFMALEAGKRYYLEAVYREGTGTDGVSVFWQIPGGPALPTANTNSQAVTGAFLIPARYLSPFTTFGNVFLTQDLPPTVTAPESTRPTLSVAADGTRPYFYQWYKNGVPIPGATAASCVLPYLRATDNGAAVTVVVSNHFSSVTSSVATLTVTADTVKPTVVSAGSLFKQLVEVRLSEPVTSASATATANYQLRTSGGATVAVTAAVQDPDDPARITLQTDPMPETDRMELTVSGLVDLSAAANVMQPQTVYFRANNFDALTRINNPQAYGATAAGDQLTLTGGGADIWGTSDQFLFLHKAVTGNFDYKVQGVSLQAMDPWSKMGIMARAGTTPDARYVFILFTPPSPGQNTYAAQVRTNTGSATDSSNEAVSVFHAKMQPGVPVRPTLLPYPSWVRLQRIGDNFYLYYGADGTNWTFWTWYDSTVSPAGALPQALEVGLALTSHNTTQTGEGVLASFMAVDEGPLHFTLQPTNTTAVENSSATFYAAAGGRRPWSYQWLRGNEPIAGATNATLVLPSVSYCTDHNVQFACRISNPYGEIVTAVATLSVIQDTTPPTVRVAATPKINFHPTRVELLFSEPVSAATAQNAANYQIFTSPGNVPLAVTEAVLQPDNRTVALITGSHTPGTLYRVVVNNVQDRACYPNTVAANSTDYYFHAGAGGSIAWVSYHAADDNPSTIARNMGFTNAPDVGYTTLLARKGYPVTRIVSLDNAHTNQAYLDNFTNFNLVILARATPSGHYEIAQEVQVWSAVPRPMMVMPGWTARSNRLGFVTGNTLPDAEGMKLWLKLHNPAHPIFAGIPVDGNNLMINPYAQRMYAPHTNLLQLGISVPMDPVVASATLLATVGASTAANEPTLNGVIIAEVPPKGTSARGVNFADRRLVFLSGSRDAAGFGGGDTAGIYDLFPDGERMFLNAINYLMPPLATPPAPPSITISAPTNGQTFVANANIPITASVSGPSPILRVEFYADAALIGTATNAPYAITWANVPEGAYTLTARVTDLLGYEILSAPVQIAVVAPQPPTLGVQLQQGNVVIDWDGTGTLWTATNVLGPWTSLGPTKPYSAPATAPARFFRVTRP